MEGEHHPKSGEIEKKGSLGGAEILSDELIEIDPADFIDPDEFGQRPTPRIEREKGNWNATPHA
jgi:hypothetical protein